MPEHKAIHICNSHKPSQQPKIAKEYVFANADKQKKQKSQQVTLCISNSWLSAILKRKTINQRSVLFNNLVACNPLLLIHETVGNN